MYNVYIYILYIKLTRILKKRVSFIAWWFPRIEYVELIQKDGIGFTNRTTQAFSK